jgi:hypothetical protein
MISYITFAFMPTEHSLDFWHRKRDRLVRQLSQIGPLIDGSLVTIARTCGARGCKCTRGFKHQSRYLTYKAPVTSGDTTRMKTHTVYVPVALEEQVGRWVKEHQRLKVLVKEIAEVQRAIIRSYVKQKGRGHRKGNRISS